MFLMTTKACCLVILLVLASGDDWSFNVVRVENFDFEFDSVRFFRDVVFEGDEHANLLCGFPSEKSTSVVDTDWHRANIVDELLNLEACVDASGNHATYRFCPFGEFLMLAKNAHRDPILVGRFTNRSHIYWNTVQQRWQVKLEEGGRCGDRQYSATVVFRCRARGASISWTVKEVDDCHHTVDLDLSTICVWEQAVKKSVVSQIRCIEI